MNEVDRFMSRLMSNLDGSKDAQIKKMSRALEKIACRHVTEAPLWWQQEARDALASVVGSPTGERT